MEKYETLRIDVDKNDLEIINSLLKEKENDITMEQIVSKLIKDVIVFKGIPPYIELPKDGPSK